MNPKFALLVDTTEELLQAVVATAPISLFAFDHTDAITLSEGRLWPHQMVARGRHVFILHSHYAPEGNRPKICLWRGAC
jgi:hypothetical protein